MYLSIYVNRIALCSCNWVFSGYNDDSPKQSTMNRELQNFEALFWSICTDIKSWFWRHEDRFDFLWANPPLTCAVIALLLIIFVLPRFVRKEHIDTNHEEGSES